MIMFIGLLNIFRNYGWKNLHTFGAYNEISVKGFCWSNSVGRIYRKAFFFENLKNMQKIWLPIQMMY